MFGTPPDMVPAYDASKFAAFRIGVTTKSDVVQALGRPELWFTDTDGNSTLSYPFHMSDAGTAILGMTRRVSASFTFEFETRADEDHAAGRRGAVKRGGFMDRVSLLWYGLESIPFIVCGALWLLLRPHETLKRFILTAVLVIVSLPVGIVAIFQVFLPPFDGVHELNPGVGVIAVPYMAGWSFAASLLICVTAIVALWRNRAR